MPLWAIFKIESMEMCPRHACQISTEADAVVVHATHASLTFPFPFLMYLVMYAHSAPIAVQGSLYNPSSCWATPICSSSELRSKHLFLMNRTSISTSLRWEHKRRFVPISAHCTQSYPFTHLFSRPLLIYIFTIHTH